MTIGQRIAQKRKEAGLSQEGLGELLGLSRQAIYKWESDTTLPEIENLVALSRIFAVPVGWLLGVEDGSEDGEDAPRWDGELTEAQLKMVQEIVERYIAAQPKPAAPPKRRRWPWVLAAAVLIVVFVSLFSRLNDLRNQYNSLQNTVGNINSSVSGQISSITSRVEEILKDQNSLTADYSTEFLGADESGTMGTFSWRARPKTYAEGMVAYVDIVNEAARITYGPYDSVRGVFSGDFTVALTDHTEIYVIFEHEGVRETQHLDTYDYLYSNSAPAIWLHDDLWGSEHEGVLSAGSACWQEEEKDLGYPDQATAVEIRVGLFRDQELLHWYREDTRTVTMNGVEIQQPCWTLDQTVTLEPGHIYAVAAVVTDSYGRTWIMIGSSLEYDINVAIWTPAYYYRDTVTPDGWTYE